MTPHGLPTLRRGEQKEVAKLVEAGRSIGCRNGDVFFCCGELFVETHALDGKADIEFIGELLAYPSHRPSAGARCQGVAFQDDDACRSTHGKLIGDADSDDATADNDDVCCRHECLTTAIAKPSV